MTNEHFENVFQLPVDLQPDEWTFIDPVDGIAIKRMILRKGMYVPQHQHAYSHISLLASGMVRAWSESRDGDWQLLGDFEAPHGIRIEAHRRHMFLSLMENTIVDCIHNVSRTGEIEVEKEGICLGLQ